MDLWGFRRRDQWWYGAIAAVLLGSMVVPLAWVTDGPIACPTRHLFEVPCPGCGLTRSFALMGHWRGWEAWGHHPFGVVIWWGLWVVLLGRLSQRWSGSTASLCPEGLFANWWVRGFVAVWMVWGLWRLWDRAAG